MTTQIEELSTEIKGLETSLAAEKDDAKKADIQKTLDEKKSKHKELVEDEKTKIPYYKFQKVNNDLKEAQTKLAEIEKKEKKAAEDKLKKDGDYQKVIEQKDAEITKLNTQLEQLIGEQKQSKVNGLLLKEIAKKDPYDAEDVLRLIDKGKLTIKEVDGNVTIDGVISELESIKKAKPHLFKVKSNDKKDDDENHRGNAGSLDSVESEFKILQAKPTLTPQEQARFSKLGEQLMELRKAAAGKK